MRPKNEFGITLPVAHKRLEVGAFHTAAIAEMNLDPRASALPLRRKMAMVDKAVDYVIDGEQPPAWVFVSDERTENHFLRDLWHTAVKACEQVRRTGAF
jgi:hypothetical protein